MKRSQAIVWGGCLLAALFVFTGCARTQQERSVEPSGFLGDYSQLKTGGGERALLYYIDPAADFAGYDKIIIDDVAVWTKADVDEEQKKEFALLATYMKTAMERELQKDYTIVDEPGPGTIRLRTAVTSAQGANVALDVVTTYIPVGRVLSEGKNLALGTQSFVGSAAVEMELLDSMTNERLAAAVDARAGGKTFKSLDTWGDAKEAIDWWAERIRMRLAEVRAGEVPDAQ